MASRRVRENRENQFYDVGVQGRKTGITLEDKGVRDEHGLEPLSGIFSSPQKSPPKPSALDPSGGTVTDSESMDIQESSIPDITTSAHLLRTSRTHLPPPKSRSPIKTTLGSSPRRQSSIAPRARSANLPSSPPRAVSHPAVNRRLDFVQDESSLQETPALSGSGQPRGKRPSVYDIEDSPSRANSITLEESIQEEITAAEDPVDLGEEYMGEESYMSDIGQDVDAEITDEVTQEAEDTELIPDPPKLPGKRGRKRKSEVVEPPMPEPVTKTRRRGAPLRESLEKPKKNSKTAAAGPASEPRRSKRVSEHTEEESNEPSTTTITDIDTSLAQPKRRGRPPKNGSQPEKAQESVTMKQKPKSNPKSGTEEPVFKKPKSAARPPKEPAKNPTSNGLAQNDLDQPVENGKFVDVHGNPISKADIDQMSTTSAGSRFARGRYLSVFRELEPQDVALPSRTGRHRVQPIEFWKNEKCSYDSEGNMQAIVKNEMKEPVRPAYSGYKAKKKRKRLPVIEDDEVLDLEPWEEEEGVFNGIFKDWDVEAEVPTNDLVESNLAWSTKGINPVDVADASFKFTKLSSAGSESFMSWGFIELNADQMKRSKNSRRMHLVFHVQSGAVEVKVHENVFTVHRGGVWHVPRGNTYSMKNVGSATSRIFFAQAFESRAEAE
ncbi:unnamed protein product [Periconia digitata]|uniref:CENP-C homolog n=1 Tax=Periconia digitata TaxID=1303443 RepID=A0A9W4U9D0_9PLEO|nr:unnamed protein product [Periconia digitata]